MPRVRRGQGTAAVSGSRTLVLSGMAGVDKRGVAHAMVGTSRGSRSACDAAGGPMTWIVFIRPGFPTCLRCTARMFMQ